MRRTKFVRYLRKHGCEPIREGKKHSIFRNPANAQTAPVPRHREIDTMLVLAICKELRIPGPAER